MWTPRWKSYSPHEDFLHKINAVRYSLELGVENGLIVARTDSLGAGLTQKVPVMQEQGDLADQYNSFLETEEITNLEELDENDITIHQNVLLVKPVRLPNGLYRFKEGTGFDRVVLDCITSLQNGADLYGLRQKNRTYSKLLTWLMQSEKSNLRLS